MFHTLSHICKVLLLRFLYEIVNLHSYYTTDNSRKILVPLPLMGNDILAHCSRKSASGRKGHKASLAWQRWSLVRWMTHLHTILNAAELHNT